MNKQVTKYLLEISIIFIGVTLGFWVNDFRNSIHDNTKRREVYHDLKAELIRAKEFITETNATNSTAIMGINSFLIHTPIPDHLKLQLFSTLVSQFSNDLNGIMNHSLTLVNSNSLLLSHNDTLGQNVAYIRHIVEDHNKIRASIQELTDQQLWPILEKYSITIDLNDFQRNAHDITNLKGDYLSFSADKEIRPIFRHIRFKKNEQKIIYEILISHLDKMILQLTKETR